MAIELKKKGQIFDEINIQTLVGKTIHVPTNKHEVSVDLENGRKGTTTVNAWFAGEVAGYEKAYLKYDYQKGEMLEEARLFFNILLTDGMSYQLNVEDSEIVEITEEEFVTLLAEFQAAEAVKQKAEELIVPEKPRIILPGE